MERVAPSSFVLKVNISCHGCERDIEKLIQKIPGVWPKSTIIDAKQGRVTVSGFVDPQTVIRELRKAGKIAELLVAHNPRDPPAANGRNLQIISRSEVDVGNPRGQVVFVDPVRLVANNVAQFVNGIERLKEVEVTRDRIKIAFYDYPSGGNWKYSDTSRGSGGGGGGGGGTSRSSGGGGTTSILTSISRGGGGITSISRGGGGTTSSGGMTSISRGGGGMTSISRGGGGTSSIHTSISGGGGTTSISRGGGRRISLREHYNL